jgi:hypothetical protein
MVLGTDQVVLNTSTFAVKVAVEEVRVTVNQAVQEVTPNV